MRRNLEYAVRGRVDDRFAGPHVLVAEFGDDRGAGRMAVAEHSGQSRAFHERVDQCGRKGVGTVGEIAPVEEDGYTGDLPVAARRVLAAG